MIKRTIIDSVVIHENMVSPRQAADTHVKRLSLISACLQSAALPICSAHNRQADKLLFRALPSQPQLVVVVPKGIEGVGERWPPSCIWGAGREFDTRVRRVLVF